MQLKAADLNNTITQNQGTVFSRQILPNSTAQFVKFREIPWHCYPQIPCIPRPVGIVVLTDCCQLIYCNL